jgi:HK97 family phage major capsid protein
MKNSDQLKMDRAAKLDAQRNFVNAAKTENREFTAEENTSFDGLTSEIENITAQIERAAKFEANELRAAAAANNVIVAEVVDAPKERFSIHRAIASQLKGGVLSGIEKETHERSLADAKDANVTIGGIAIPMQNRAGKQTVTGDTGTAGGNLVSTDLQAPIDFLRPAPLVEKLGATYLRDLRGNVRFPKNQGGIVATWEGETATVAASANLYGYIDMIPKRLSVTVPISLQNLLQSSFDLELYTINQINAAIADAMDKAAINGSGTGQPLGILNNGSVSVVATGANGDAPTWDMIVDSETNVFVENASAARMSYIVNPKTRGKLKKSKHAAGDLNYIMGTDGTVNGYAVETSNHVPGNLTKGTGTNLSAVAFGDWSQLLIGQWGFMDLSVDEYSRKKEGLVEVTVNVFADVLVKEPKAFSVIKGLITV